MALCRVRRNLRKSRQAPITWPTLDRMVGFVMLATFAYTAITLILQ